MTSRERVLSPNDIPASLWNSKIDRLFLPAVLVEAYADVIHCEGLLELAKERNGSAPPIGGPSLEAANQHFAQAFDGSVARALLAILDPKAEAETTSDTFIRITAGNAACITDAPCGAGAATLAFLCVLAELRKSQVLPRLPLKVSVVGGEFSEHASAYATRLLEAVTPHLTEQAIFVDHIILPWDVTDPMSNTDLIKCALSRSTGTIGKLLVVANFNGFLEGGSKRQEAMPQLNELFRFASGSNSFAVWIEPQMNRATSSGGLFAALSKFFSTFWAKHVTGKSGPMEGQKFYTSEAEFERALFKPSTANVRLAVMPINLHRDVT